MGKDRCDYDSVDTYDYERSPFSYLNYWMRAWLKINTKVNLFAASSCTSPTNKALGMYTICSTSWICTLKTV